MRVTLLLLCIAYRSALSSGLGRGSGRRRFNSWCENIYKGIWIGDDAQCMECDPDPDVAKSEDQVQSHILTSLLTSSSCVLTGTCFLLTRTSYRSFTSTSWLSFSSSSWPLTRHSCQVLLKESTAGGQKYLAHRFVQPQGFQNKFIFVERTSGGSSCAEHLEQIEDQIVFSKKDLDKIEATKIQNQKAEAKLKRQEAAKAQQAQRMDAEKSAALEKEVETALGGSKEEAIQVERPAASRCESPGKVRADAEWNRMVSEQDSLINHSQGR